MKNVPESNGKVGTLGISYDGFEPLMALGVHHARQMPLRHVRGFMRENAGELRLVAAREDRPVVAEDEAAEDRERVDARFAHRVVMELAGGRIGSL